MPTINMANSRRDYEMYCRTNMLPERSNETREKYLLAITNMPEHYTDVEVELCRAASLAVVTNVNPPFVNAQADVEEECCDYDEEADHDFEDCDDYETTGGYGAELEIDVPEQGMVHEMSTDELVDQIQGNIFIIRSMMRIVDEGNNNIIETALQNIEHLIKLRQEEDED